MFAAIMARGGRREERNGHPCLKVETSKSSDSPESESGGLRERLTGLKQRIRSIFRSYSNQLTKWPARFTVLILLVLYWSLGIYGVFNIRIALSEDKLFMEDSPLKEVLHLNHFVITGESAKLAIFVNRPGDLRDPKRLNAIEQMIREYEELDNHIGPLSSRNFLRPFRDYLQMENGVKWRNETIFCYYQLQDFLNLGNNYQWRSYLRLNEEYCSDGAPYLSQNAGNYDDSEDYVLRRRKRQNDDVENDIDNVDDYKDDENYKMDDEYYNDDVDGEQTSGNDMKSSKKFTCSGANPKCLDRLYFVTSFRASGWAARSQLMLKWRAIADRYADLLNVTVYDEMGYYSDQYLSIGAMSLQTVFIAMACMSLICLVFIPHFAAAAFAMASILSINLGVFGFLSLWGVDLDPVSVALTLMSIGFSVDYTSHICYHFFRKPRDHGSGSDKNGAQIRPSSVIIPDKTLTNGHQIKGKAFRNGNSAKVPGPDAKDGGGMHSDHYRDEEQGAREERLWRAFDGVGWPTAQAGLSSLIGGLCMTWTPSYTFLVFVKTLVLVVGFGLAHALFIMPVLLSSLPVRGVRQRA